MDFRTEFAPRVDTMILNNRRRAASYEIEQQIQHRSTLEERNRLSRELHDNLAQTISYLNLRVSATDTLLASGQVAEARANLHELKQIIDEIYTDVREEIFNLRTNVTSGPGFLEELRQYLTRYRTCFDLSIDLSIETDEALLDLRPEMSCQVIRIIQEALVNVRKHAQVAKARLRLQQEGCRIRIRIEDEGPGFEEAQNQGADLTSHGLQIMQERAESIGGTLCIDTRAGKGTRITLWLPIN